MSGFLSIGTLVQSKLMEAKLLLIPRLTRLFSCGILLFVLTAPIADLRFAHRGSPHEILTTLGERP